MSERDLSSDVDLFSGNDLKPSFGEKFTVFGIVLFCLAMFVAIFGPIALVFWKFALWVF